MKKNKLQNNKVTSGGRPVILEALEISKSYSDGNERLDVLKKVNLTIRQGEFISIVGPSGRGKTTLFSCLTGLINPDDGKVLFDEENVELLNEKELHSMQTVQMGIIPENISLIPVMNVEENIVMSLTIAGKSSSEAKQKVKDMISQYSLEKIAGLMPLELNSVDKQKVLLLRSIVHEPKIIIADEITSSLNKKSSEAIIEFISLIKSNNKKMSIVLFTHDVNEGLRSDKMYKLEDGRLQ
jgi:putative ABC transport system ATP-binding protein